MKCSLVIGTWEIEDSNGLHLVIERICVVATVVATLVFVAQRIMLEPIFGAKEPPPSTPDQAWV